VHAAPGPLAEALAALARRCDCSGVLDVGAGRGELLAAMAAAAPDLDLHAVDVVPRPPGLPDRVGWSQSAAGAGLPDDVPTHLLDHVLVVAWELLDVVPCSVLEVDVAGTAREVLVDPASGRERLGPPAGPDDLAWCSRWWPIEGLAEGDRVEVGRGRDALWAASAARVRSGVLLGVDYGHTRAGRPPAGGLTGYRAGRAVPPVPDGSMDLTAHVALDAVADAGCRAGAGREVMTPQHEALQTLALTDAELLDPAGLGGFTWLLQPVGEVRGWQPVPVTGS
jgi:SAM-dependent MidA family methyltransferase